MKTKLTIILLCILCSTAGVAQQYGWVNISNNLPKSTGTVSLTDMHWISNNEGWICSGALGEIYHTTDGGQTFKTQKTQFYTNAIYMLNSQTGYAGGIQGRVYKTTNGGADWITHGSIGGNLLDIDFPPKSDSGYCSGYNGKIYKITTSGVSSMYTGLNSSLSSISLPDKLKGWACGGTIIVHFENGIWKTDQAYPSESYNTIHMVNNLSGWAAGDNGIIIHTEDGLTWNSQVNPDGLNKSLNDVFFLNSNEGWIVGFSGRVLHTTNGGKDWNIILDGWTTDMLLSVQFTSSTNGYILGNNKTLFKYGLLTAVEEHPTQPTEFKLEQNYPNPFKESTTIDFILETPSQVVLEVFSFSGEKICQLTNEKKSPGKYSVPFNAKYLPIGIYYYRLQTETGISAMKMILMK
jgi:photosystem II stability/assembly factor-like uncharacterized protein